MGVPVNTLTQKRANEAAQRIRATLGSTRDSAQPNYGTLEVRVESPVQRSASEANSCTYEDINYQPIEEWGDEFDCA